MHSAPSILSNLPPFEQLVQAPDRAPFVDEPQIVHVDFVGVTPDLDPEAQSLDIPAFGLHASEPPRRRFLRWLRG